jgi:hypothetical protein
MGRWKDRFHQLQTYHQPARAESWKGEGMEYKIEDQELCICSF